MASDYGYADNTQMFSDYRRYDTRPLTGRQVPQFGFQSPSVPPMQQSGFQTPPVSSIQQTDFSMPAGYSAIRIQGEAWDSRRFMNNIAIMGVLNNSPSFHQSNGVWYISERNGTQKPVASFSIDRILAINPTQEYTFEHILIQYTVQEQVFIAKIPFEKYRHRKLLSYFPNIQKLSMGQESLLNELLFDQVQNCKNGTFLTIPEKPGWNILNDKHAVFVTGNGIASFMMEFYPDSVKNM